MTDQFDIYGTWKPEGFFEQLRVWRETEHPPAGVVAQVEAWWPRMEYSDEHTRAEKIDEEDNAYAIWVPNCYLPDLGEGLQGVQCFFRLQEAGHLVICEGLHIARRMRPPEVDRADGMG